MSAAAKVVLNFCSLQLLLLGHCWQNIFSWSLSTAPASFTVCSGISQDRCSGKERAETPKLTELTPFIRKEATQVLVLSEEAGKRLWRRSSFLKVFKETLSRENIKNAWVEWERKNSYLCIKLHGDNVQNYWKKKKILCVSVFLSFDSMCLVLWLVHYRSQS